MTGVNASKLKAVEPEDLKWFEQNKCQVSMEDSKQKTEERCKDALFRLLASKSAADELQSFVRLAFECLASDEIYPVPAYLMAENICEDSDIANAQRAIEHVVNGTNLLYKRTVILAALAFSPRFVRQFCPAPSATRSLRFLVNPELMQTFAGTPTQRDPSPLQKQLAHLMCGNVSLAEFAPSCFGIWCRGLSQRPWHGVDAWSNTSANTVGREMRLHLKAQQHELTGRPADTEEMLLLGDDDADDLRLLGGQNEIGGEGQYLEL